MICMQAMPTAADSKVTALAGLRNKIKNLFNEAETLIFLIPHLSDATYKVWDPADAPSIKTR